MILQLFMQSILQPGEGYKLCTKCKKKKLVIEFGRDRGKKDGLFAWCKSCAYANSRRWQKENPEKVKRYIKEWQERNPDWRKRDPLWREKRNANSRRRQKENPEKSREKYRRWAAANPEKLKIKRTLQAALYPEQRQERRRRYKARKKQAEGKINAMEWLNLCEVYGNKCLRCGRSGVKLTMDHVLPLALGGTHTIDNVQPLCMSCNASKNKKHIDYR